MGTYEICWIMVAFVALFEFVRSFFTLKPSLCQKEKVRAFYKKKYSGGNTRGW